MTVEEWAETELGTLLDRARDGGEVLSLAEMRSALGLGHDDLMELLSHVREQGGVVEAAPGEWRRPFEDEGGSPDDGEEGELLHAHESSEETLAEAERRAQRRVAAGAGSRTVGEDAQSRVVVAAPAEGEVRLTMAVASALDPETIGKLVEAGIVEASEQKRAFVLRVEP